MRKERKADAMNERRERLRKSATNYVPKEHATPMMLTSLLELIEREVHGCP